MFQTIMAFLGYVKIPLAVIKLSIEIEKKIEQKQFSEAAKGIKAITRFLRSGRLISYK